MVRDVNSEHNHPFEYYFTSEQKHTVCKIINLYRNQMANDDSPRLDTLEREFCVKKIYDTFVKLPKEVDRTYCEMMKWYVWKVNRYGKAEGPAVGEALEIIDIKCGGKPQNNT